MQRLQFPHIQHYGQNTETKLKQSLYEGDKSNFVDIRVQEYSYPSSLEKMDFYETLSQQDDSEQERTLSKENLLRKKATLMPSTTVDVQRFYDDSSDCESSNGYCKRGGLNFPYCNKIATGNRVLKQSNSVYSNEVIQVDDENEYSMTSSTTIHDGDEENDDDASSSEVVLGWTKLTYIDMNDCIAEYERGKQKSESTVASDISSGATTMNPMTETNSQSSVLTIRKSDSDDNQFESDLESRSQMGLSKSLSETSRSVVSEIELPGTLALSQVNDTESEKFKNSREPIVIQQQQQVQDDTKLPFLNTPEFQRELEKRQKQTFGEIISEAILKQPQLKQPLLPKPVTPQNVNEPFPKKQETPPAKPELTLPNLPEEKPSEPIQPVVETAKLVISVVEEMAIKKVECAPKTLVKQAFDTTECERKMSIEYCDVKSKIKKFENLFKNSNTKPSQTSKFTYLNTSTKLMSQCFDSGDNNVLSKATTTPVQTF